MRSFPSCCSCQHICSHKTSSWITLTVCGLCPLLHTALSPGTAAQDVTSFLFRLSFHTFRRFIFCRTREAGCSLRDEQEGRHQNREPGKAQRICSHEGESRFLQLISDSFCLVFPFQRVKYVTYPVSWPTPSSTPAKSWRWQISHVKTYVSSSSENKSVIQHKNPKTVGEVCRHSDAKQQNEWMRELIPQQEN